MDKKLTPQQYEHLQKYLDALMMEGERRIFENELQQNALLREQLQFELELEQHLIALADKGDDISTLIAETEKAANPASAKQLQEQIAQVAAEWKKSGKNTNEENSPIRTIDLSSRPKTQAAPVRLRNYAILIAACAAALLGMWFFWPNSIENGNPVLVKSDTPKTNPRNNQVIVQHPVDSNTKNPPPVIVQQPVDSGAKNIPTQPPKPSAQELYADYFKQDATPTEVPPYLAEALSDLDAGEYTTILGVDLDNISPTRGSSSDEQNNVKAIGRYYQGFAYLQRGSTADAVKAFKDVRTIKIAAPTDSLHYKATWYLAMAYLKKGSPKEAKPLFQELAKDKRSNKFYVKKSQDILKQME